MKKLFVIALGSFLLNLNIAAQTVYQASDVTPKFLKVIFDNAFIEVLEVKDNYIVVKDVFTIYIDIDANKRFVTFSSTYPLVTGAKKLDVLELMNIINKEVAQIKVYFNESNNSVSYYYYFWTEGGFTVKSMISAVRLYKSALTLSLNKDEKKLIK
jgi:hypothetical protein